MACLTYSINNKMYLNMSETVQHLNYFHGYTMNIIQAFFFIGDQKTIEIQILLNKI